MNHHLRILGTALSTIAVCMACRPGVPSAAAAGAAAATADSTLAVTYAHGFTVSTRADGVRLVDISDPQRAAADVPDGDATACHLALVPRSAAPMPALPDGYTPVRVPVQRAIVMTMLQLSNFVVLDALDVVRGITGTKNLFNAEVRRRVGAGQIVKIGMEGNFDTELILSAEPEVIFISPFKRGGYDALRETGITLIPHLGYKELTPLGQAEWLKLVGLFTGKEQEAARVFAGIEQRYNSLRTRAAQVARRPTVLSGEMHGTGWYAVGGRSTLAQLFRDAGAEYVVKDDNTGGVSIDFEQLYAMAADADYWRILNSYPGHFSYDALLAADARNGLFRAAREHRVIYCNMRQSAYYERTPVEPDVLLADLVAIFHPELMPADYEPTFYRLLED